MEELIEKFKEGDKEAFTELIRNIKNDLYKIAKMRLSCEDDINDAVQETMIEAFNSIKKLKDSLAFKKWIYTILINRCNIIYKKRKKYNISFENLQYDKYLIINETENLEKELEFYNLLKILNYNERIAIILFYKEDYTSKEISKILRVSENTIKTRLKRAKEKIKKYIEGSL